jgi:putative endonuclease
MAQHNDLGKQGENIACEHLINNGYFILDRSWTYQKAELDIVALKENTLIVIEVKTRHSYHHADPDDTVSNKKLLQIYNATDQYMEVKKIPWEVRYDLITIIFHGDSWTIDHIEDAFYPFMKT